MEPTPELSLYEQFIEEWKARIAKSGQWESPITQKQAAIAGFSERYILASGPRYSTKTTGILDALVRHAWEIPDAEIAFIAISQTNAADGGAWKDLTKSTSFAKGAIPTWIEADFGMKWIEEPRFTTHTHKNYCQVSNKFGGTANIQLYTLADEGEVEDLFKNKSFTMIVITELSKFKKLKTFITLQGCFRQKGRPSHHFKLLADTNPPEEGDQSWMYDLWFRPLELPYESRDESQKQFRLIQFNLDDNIFYTEAEKQEIRDRYKHDPEWYRRDVLGEWIRVSDGGFFQGNFSSTLHVVPGPHEEKDQEMTLQENCSLLMTGTDIGSGINHSAHIIEPFFHNGRKCYKILEEIISVGLEIGIEDFTAMIVEAMDRWEAEAGKPLKMAWDHWSDADVFNFTATAKTHKHKIVYAASAGRIELRAADKGPGSVRPRLQLLKQLFHEDRLFINRTCYKTIHAFQNIKKVDPKRMASATNPIDPRDPLKHPIDSLSYAILMDMGEEANLAMMVATKKASPGIIELNI